VEEATKAREGKKVGGVRYSPTQAEVARRQAEEHRRLLPPVIHRFREKLALRIAPWLYTEPEAVEWVSQNCDPWDVFGRDWTRREQ
jgi:hypothetical protein